MSDNTTLNPGAGGDSIRDLARQAGNVKTQTFQLDLGGAAANAEILITAGRQLMAASVPVALASDQPSIATTNSADPYRGTSSYMAGAAGTVTIASGARIVSLSATSVTGGTLSILGGANITVPANAAFSEGYVGFGGPGNIVFTGTASYYVAVNI